MGYNHYTSEQLLKQVYLKSHVGIASETFSRENVLDLANDELQLSLIAQILSSRGGYYLDYEDYIPNATGLYRIPSKAIGGVLQTVQLVQDTVIVPVNIIEQAEQFSTMSPNTTSYGAFMQGNFVQIIPNPNVGNPRLWFLKRPSKIILTNEAAQINSVNGNILNVNAVPSTFQINTKIDALGDQPPFNVLGERHIVNVAGKNIQLDEPVIGLEPGDWLALHEQTPIPQIPVEYRPLLEQRTVVKIYEVQGYLDKMKAAKETLKELEAQTLSLITPRIKTQTKIINPSNGGLMVGAKRGWGNYPASPHQ